MGDMGDYFNAWKEHKREQKRRYQQHSMPRDLELLDRLEGVSYEIRNRGEHYMLTVETERGPVEVDYWPSTGRWRARQGKATGFGVRKIKNYYRLYERAQ